MKTEKAHHNKHFKENFSQKVIKSHIQVFTLSDERKSCCNVREFAFILHTFKDYEFFEISEIKLHSFEGNLNLSWEYLVAKFTIYIA